MKNRFQNWQDVRVFLAVMRAGSTLAASRKLGIAQPTVARRIDVLEHETGLTLFERDTRGFRPTDAAQGLLAAAEEMERAAAAFAETSETIQRERDRPIRFTASAANFSARFAEIVAEFSDLYPNVRFDLIPSYKVLDLRAGEADIALRISQKVDDPDLISRKISTARFTVFASERYIKAHGKPSSPDDFAGHRFTTFLNENVSTRLHDWLMRRISPAQVVSATKSVDAQITAIQSGLGIGVLNVGLARSTGGLIPCFDPPAELDAPHLMLISPEAYRRPEVRAFTEFFAPRYAKLFRDQSAQK